MFKNKYKFTILFELILLLTLFLITYIIPGDIFKRLISINKIQYFNIYACLNFTLITIVIVFLISFFLIKKKNQNSNIEVIQNILWKYSFYIVLLFSLSILILSLVIKETTTQTLTLGLKYIIFKTISFSIAIILFSVIISYILIKINSISRIKTFFLSNIAIVLFVLPILFSLIYFKIDLDTKSLNYEKSDVLEEEYFEENDSFIIDENSFADLWDTPEDDYNIVTQLTKFVIYKLIIGTRFDEDNNRILNFLNVDIDKTKSYLKDSISTERSPFNLLDNYSDTKTYFAYDESENIESDENTESYQQNESIEEEIRKEKEANENDFFIGISKKTSKIYAKVFDNPVKIEKYFDKYSSIIYSIIDKKIYQESTLESLVKALIITHNDFKKLSTKKKEYLFKELHKENEKANQDKPYELRGIDELLKILKPSISNETLSKLDRLVKEDEKHNDETYDIEYFAFWSNSFWIRRYKDGNDEQVFNILKKIESHYN